MKVVLLAILMVGGAMARGFDCPSMPSSDEMKCDCSRGPNDYDVNCDLDRDHKKHFTVLITPGRLRLTCSVLLHNEDWPRIKQVMGLFDVGKLSQVNVHSCPEPSPYSYSEILESAGITYLNNLSVERTDGQRLTGYHLSTVNGLTRLELTKNNLTTVPVGLLAHQWNLTNLDLKNNRLILPKGFFANMTRLEVLELGSNNMSSLEPGVFKNLSRLRLLNLWSNRLHNLTRPVFTDLHSLESLDISGNYMHSLMPDLFTDLMSLNQINLSKNNFTFLPHGLFSSNTHLTRFQIIENLKTLRLTSGLLSNLSRLREVKIISCRMTELPDDLLAGSTRLETLNLTYNHLTELPQGLFRDAGELKHLDLRKNQLSYLPDAVFYKLSKLTHLNLSHNKLTIISSELFSSMESLEVLRLDHNLIMDVAGTAFINMKSLKSVWLSNNEISSLHNRIQGSYDSVFGNCIELEEIYLSHNRLDVIYDDWKIKTKLRLINLTHNHFTKIEFGDLVMLSTYNPMVDLGYNVIKEVDFEKLENEVELRRGSDWMEGKEVRLRLAGNPVRCDCRTLGLARFMRQDAPREAYYMVKVEGDVMCDLGLVSEVPLEELRCTTDQCPIPCSCQLRPVDSVFEVDCSGRGLTTVPLEVMPVEGATNVELDLSHNQIKSLPSIPGRGYQYASKLSLSHNWISHINSSSLNSKLQLLLLDHNNLTGLGQDMITFLSKSKSMRNVTLHSNPLDCSCSALPLTYLIQANYSMFPNRHNITCKGGVRKLSELTVNDLCPTSVTLIATLSTLLAALGLLIGGAIALYYKYQQEINVWLFAHNWCLWCITKEDLDKHKQYHAFISYSHQDEDFVVNKLVPGLDGYKLCLHYRDFEVGEMIPNSIAKSVAESRRTVIVLSPAFLKSDWGRLEFRTAHKQAMDERTNRVIMILYRDIGPVDKLDPELKAYLSVNTYVKWGDPWFWDKLKYALPHLPKPKSHSEPPSKPV